MIPEELKAVHRTREHGPHTTRPMHVAGPSELMEGWVTTHDSIVEGGGEESAASAVGDGLDDDALAALGL